MNWFWVAKINGMNFLVEMIEIHIKEKRQRTQTEGSIGSTIEGKTIMLCYNATGQ